MARPDDEIPEVVPTTAADWTDKIPGKGVFVRVSTPNAPKAAAPEPDLPGDEVIDQAKKMADFTEGEKAQGHLIRSSIDLVIKKGQEDPVYGERVAGELSSLTGEEYASKAVDEADKLKIEYLKKNFPDRFTGPQAAMTSFLNEASFGQLSRMIGYTGALVSDVPAEDLIKQKAEEFRLLSKAFPGSDFVGKASAFLVPGSPVKKLFEKSARIGAKGAAVLLGSFAKNPSLMAKMFQSAASGAAGAAAVGAVEGELGRDNEEAFDLDRAVDTAAKAGFGAGVIGAMIPPAGQALSAGVKAAAPIVRKGAKAFGRTVERTVEELSGVPAKSLRAYNRNPRAMRDAAGSENDIGQDLVAWLMDRRKSKLPELEAADALLDRLPDVPIGKLLTTLRSAKKGVNPQLDSQVSLVHEWADRIASKYPGAKKIPARQMRELVDELQDAAADQFGKESNFYVTAIKKASHEARMSIIETAKAEGGAAGKMYDRAMTKAAEKTGLLKYISRQLGRDEVTMRKNAQGFIDRVFAKNNEFRAARLADLDTKFGTNFLERSKLAQMAEEVGPKGSPAFFSSHRTGKAMLGTVTGGAVSGPAGAAVGAAISSPKLGSVLLGTSDAMTGFARRLLANPEAIQRLAGREMAKLPAGVGVELFNRGGSRQNQAAYDAGAKKLALLKVPVEVQRLAQEIEKTLVKDGPKSAMGTIRIIADTPYFAGLVHYYDLVERQQGRQDTKKAISKMGNENAQRKTR